MKKLKCSSCGGEINIDEDKEFGTCPYCGTKYKLNEDVNLNIKLDDNMKEVLNNGFGMAKHFSKFMIFPIVVVVFIFIMIIFSTIKGSSSFDKSSFNDQFFSASGTKNTFFLKGTLDDIIESNKTHKKKVALEFDGKETTDEKEIIEIKHSLSGNYEVSLNYDEKGYVNKIVIEKIENDNQYNQIEKQMEETKKMIESSSEDFQEQLDDAQNQFNNFFNN